MNKNKITKKNIIIIDIFIFTLISFLLLLIIYILDDSRIDKNILKNQETVSLISSENLIDIKGKNDIYVGKIKKEYGIIVEYGESTKDYSTKFNATIQTNENIINNNLNILYKTLQKYPSEVFSKYNNLTIILFDKFENTDLALASRSGLNNFSIYICNTEKFERTLHHEIYHILEYHIEDNNEVCFTSWNKLNPTNFKYDSNLANLNDLYVYNSKVNSLLDYSNIYFVSKYSKTSEQEDRAETFAEAMLIINSANFLKNTKNLNEKIKEIDNQIKNNITVKNLYYYKFIE